MNDAIIAAAFALVPTAMSLFLFIRYRELQNKFQKLTKGIDNKNLVELVSRFSKQQELLSDDIVAMNREFSRIREDTKYFFRKVGLVRYQGFKDTGGDQSFSVALLDHTDSGFILTSLYGRGFSKMYAKRIENGAASHTLTDEEQQALVQAKKQ